MKRLFLALMFGLGMASAVNAAVVVTLRESPTGGVEFNLSGSGTFDGSVPLTHLGFVFFDNIGDAFSSDPLFSGSSLQPFTLGPFGQVSSNVLIQSVVFDDDSTSDGSDDIALRFFSPGASNGDPIAGPFSIQTNSVFSTVQGNAFGLTFSMLNPGIYTSSDAQAQAFGGLTLVIEDPADVPLPAGGWLLLSGLGAFALVRRRARRS